jgi:peptidoglycan biosynthesis protein MviN/MurJ (putative lipid II flippase)
LVVWKADNKQHCGPVRKLSRNVVVVVMVVVVVVVVVVVNASPLFLSVVRETSDENRDV